MTPSFAELLRIRYTVEGRTLAAIAAELTTSSESVRRALIEAGIPRRPRGSPAGKHMPAGGLTVDGDGYHLRLLPEHPSANAGGYVREHRLVLEAHLGRYLDLQEVVAHINGDRSDNSPANLALFASSSEFAHASLQGNSHAAGDLGNEKRRVRRTRSPEQMLFDLARLHAALGRDIRRRDLEPPAPSHRSVARKFGSWQLGVAAALARYGTTTSIGTTGRPVGEGD